MGPTRLNSVCSTPKGLCFLDTFFFLWITNCSVHLCWTVRLILVILKKLEQRSKWWKKANLLYLQFWKGSALVFIFKCRILSHRSWKKAFNTRKTRWKFLSDGTTIDCRANLSLFPCGVGETDHSLCCHYPSWKPGQKPPCYSSSLSPLPRRLPMEAYSDAHRWLFWLQVLRNKSASDIYRYIHAKAVYSW